MTFHRSHALFARVLDMAPAVKRLGLDVGSGPEKDRGLDARPGAYSIRRTLSMVYRFGEVQGVASFRAIFPLVPAAASHLEYTVSTLSL
jgi:hypothetical protein